MDRITENSLNAFAKEHDLISLPEDKRFEHFACSLTIGRMLSEPLDTSDVVVGAGSDTGIDGIGIIVNGVLIADSEDIKECLENNKYLEVTFIFVQAKTSSSFNAAEMGTFSFGVNDFFSTKPTLPRNEDIKNAATIMEEIYKNSGKFTKGRPTCKLYYVTTGKWIDDKNLESRRLAAISDLTATNLLGEVDFIPVDVDKIQILYRESKNSVSCEFDFAQKAVIPNIQGVKEAYLGLLPAKEFLKLIQDDQGQILKSVFYDNIRDWQEYNGVNSEMKETLKSKDERARFSLMNNGITIITKTLRPTGNKFYIEDYQIVNGCQTSHVLFDQRNELDDTVMVPLRLIATSDENITASIIKATNRQTPVSEENLLALSDFQRKLEDFFQTFSDTKKLHYERRSRQYNSTNVEKTRVVTTKVLIRSFAAMFLEEPHTTTKNYRALLDKVGKEIFKDGDHLEPYYIAAFANYRLDCLFRSQTIDAKLKRPARYHVLLALRILLSQKLKKPSQMNSKDMKKYCEKIMESMSNSVKTDIIFKKSAKAVLDVAGSNLNSDNLRTASFTKKLIEHCNSLIVVP